MEVLISAFIMAVGLLGVAALLPVGYHEANSGTVADRAALIGQQAFRDFRIRGLIPKARANASQWNQPLVLPKDDPTYVPKGTKGAHHRYRSGDDPKYTWMVWACREPHDPDQLKAVSVGGKEGYADNFSDRYLDYSKSLEKISTDDSSLVRVVVFVFHLEEIDEAKKKYAFDPSKPEICPIQNRPVAVFEKIMRIDRKWHDALGANPQPDTTLWGLGLEL